MYFSTIRCKTMMQNLSSFIFIVTASRYVQVQVTEIGHFT